MHPSSPQSKEMADESMVRFLVIAPERTELVRYKLARSPLLREAIEAGPHAPEAPRRARKEAVGTLVELRKGRKAQAAAHRFACDAGHLRAQRVRIFVREQLARDIDASRR